MIASPPACERFAVPLALNWTICMVSLSISSGIVYSKGSLEIKGMAADSVNIKVLYLTRREVVNRRTEGFEERIVLDKERRWKKKKRYTLDSQFKSHVRMHKELLSTLQCWWSWLSIGILELVYVIGSRSSMAAEAVFSFFLSCLLAF